MDIYLALVALVAVAVSVPGIVAIVCLGAYVKVKLSEKRLDVEADGRTPAPADATNPNPK